VSAASRSAEFVRRAFAAHKSGQLDDAERAYRRALEYDPGQFDALHMLGALAVQRGRYQAAAETLARAVLIRPRHALAQFNLGVAELRCSRHAEALEAFDRALALNHRHAPSLHSRGNALAGLGRLAEALESYRRALEAQPDYLAAWQDRARIALRLGDGAETLAAAEQALRLDPGALDMLTSRAAALDVLGRTTEAAAAAAELIFAWRAGRAAPPPTDAAAQARERFEEGNLLISIRRFDAAAACFAAARELAPGYLEAAVNEAGALTELGRLDEAAARYQAVLELNPDSIPALLNLARIRLGGNRPAEALELVGRALALDPESVDALGSRAFAYALLQDPARAVAECDRLIAREPLRAETFNVRGVARLALGDEAGGAEDFERAIALAPRMGHALMNHGAVCLRLRRFGPAIDSFRRAVESGPQMEFVRGGLIHAKQQVADWSEFDRDVAELRRLLRPEVPHITPFAVIAALDDPEAQQQCARRQTTATAPAVAVPLYRGERYRHERIRIAYLSADFKNHATTVLMAGLFEAHDRDRFEVIGVSFSSDDCSAMRQRVHGSFDRLLDVRRLPDAVVAEKLRELQVDVAIDLKGHTAENRPAILAHRPAPVQVNYLGYPGTMGAAFIDYLLADEFLIPAAERGYYDERIVYLPDSYQVNDRSRPLPTGGATRLQAGLPSEGLVFACFNNNYKITPQLYSVWMRLLLATPGSVLWLLADNPLAAANLRREAELRGVPASRLVFAERCELAEHLARHRLADLFLDTLPCNAHTTASDALWAGLPLLTCAGRSFPARVAGSVLRAAGLGELVTSSLADYEALGLALGRDPQRLARLRQHLESGRHSLPLFDTPRFARHLEAAYLEMVGRARRGDPPADFHVARLPPVPAPTVSQGC